MDDGNKDCASTYDNMILVYAIISSSAEDPVRVIM